MEQPKENTNPQATEDSIDTARRGEELFLMFIHGVMTRIEKRPALAGKSKGNYSPAAGLQKARPYFRARSQHTTAACRDHRSHYAASAHDWRIARCLLSVSILRNPL